MQQILTEWHKYLKEAPGITFYELIDLSRDGDVLSLRFNEVIKHWGLVAVFKPGTTYRGFVRGGKITLQHEYVPVIGKFSTVTKEELKQKIRDEGKAPCVLADCNSSTATRDNRTVSIAAVMANPRLAAPARRSRRRVRPPKTATAPQTTGLVLSPIRGLEPAEPAARSMARIAPAQIEKECRPRWPNDPRCKVAAAAAATAEPAAEVQPAKEKECRPRWPNDPRCK